MEWTIFLKMIQDVEMEADKASNLYITTQFHLHESGRCEIYPSLHTMEGCSQIRTVFLLLQIPSSINLNNTIKLKPLLSRKLCHKSLLDLKVVTAR